MSAPTVRKRIREFDAEIVVEDQPELVRRPGGGHQRLVEKDAGVVAALEELVGEYANGGREWQPQGEPERVGVHDFPDPAVGKAIHHGIYDVGATTTRSGLAVDAGLDTNTYPTSIKVSDDDMAAIPLTKHDFHGEWNYSITPTLRISQT